MKKKILTVVLAVVAALAVLIVLLMSNLGRVIEVSTRTFLPKLTESEVQLEKVDVKPLRGEASIQGLVIGNPEGYKSASAIQFSEFSSAGKIPTGRG